MTEHLVVLHFFTLMLHEHQQLHDHIPVCLMEDSQSTGLADCFHRNLRPCFFCLRPGQKKMTYLGPNAMLLKFYHVRPLGDQCVLEITNDVSIFLFVVKKNLKFAFI